MLYIEEKLIFPGLERKVITMAALALIVIGSIYMGMNIYDVKRGNV